MIEQQYTACHWRVITTTGSSVICMWHNEMVSGCFQDSWYEKQMKSSIREAKRSSSSTDLPLDSISSIELAWYLIECAEETKELIRQTCSLNVRRKLVETLFFSFSCFFFTHRRCANYPFRRHSRNLLWTFLGSVALHGTLSNSSGIGESSRWSAFHRAFLQTETKRTWSVRWFQWSTPHLDGVQQRSIVRDTVLSYTSDSDWYPAVSNATRHWAVAQVHEDLQCCYDWQWGLAAFLDSSIQPRNPNYCRWYSESLKTSDRFFPCRLFIGHRSHRVSSTGIAVFVARKRVFHLRAVVDSRYRSRWDEDILRDLRALESGCHRGIVFLILDNYRDFLVSGYDCFASTDGLDSRQNWSSQFCSRHYRTGRWQWEGGMVEWHPTRRKRKAPPSQAAVGDARILRWNRCHDFDRANESIERDSARCSHRHDVYCDQVFV